MAVPLFLNNVYSTVQSGSSAIGSATATGITVKTGDGPKFGTVGSGLYIPAVIVDVSTTPETVHEYVWITAVSSDTLTVTRQAESSTLYPATTSSVAAGYYIAAVVSATSLGAPLPASPSNGNVPTWSSTAQAWQAGTPTTGRLAITRIASTVNLTATAFTSLTGFQLLAVATANPFTIKIKLPLVEITSNASGIAKAIFTLTDGTNNYYLPDIAIDFSATGHQAVLPYYCDYDFDSLSTNTTFTLQGWYAGNTTTVAVGGGTGVSYDYLPAVMSQVAGG